MSAGPIYCETGHPWFGIAEPVNFFTNACILAAAACAAALLSRSPHRRRVGPWVLIALLVATGVGSFLWHGLRTMLTLRLDGLSGLSFLLALMFLWTSGLFGAWRGLAWTVGLVAVAFGALALGFFLMPSAGSGVRPLLLLPFFLVIAAAGGGLARLCRRKAGAKAGRLAALALLCAVIAAASRSADLAVCYVLPFGSHFLWHVFLSLAAYYGIATLLSLYDAKDRRGDA